MTNKYGPQTYQIEMMLERIKTLTSDEILRLRAAQDKARGRPQLFSQDPVGDMARSTTWVRARDKARGAAQLLAWHADWEATWVRAWFKPSLGIQDEGSLDDLQGAQDATGCAVNAVSARHLIGQHGFTFEHYDILTKPWLEVIGEFEE